MISGIVTGIDADKQAAYVKTEGKEEPDGFPVPYEKGRAPAAGDTVIIATVDGAKRIIGIY